MEPTKKIASFLIFIGINFLLLSFNYYEITGIRIISATNGGGGDYICYQYPIVEEELHNSYPIEYKATVKIIKDGIPGAGLSNAYFYVYHEDFSNEVALIGPLEFNITDGNLVSTESIFLNLEDLSYITDLCEPYDNFIFEFNVALVALVDDEIVRYDLIHPEVFPNYIFDPTSINSNIKLYLCCNLINNLQANSGSISNLYHEKLENNQKEKIKSIFPNPFTSDLQIELGDGISLNGGIEVLIYDSKGSQILHKHIPIAHKNENINISSKQFKSGIYYIQIISQKYMYSQKIVKL